MYSHIQYVSKSMIKKENLRAAKEDVMLLPCPNICSFYEIAKLLVSVSLYYNNIILIFFILLYSKYPTKREPWIRFVRRINVSVVPLGQPAYL